MCHSSVHGRASVGNTRDFHSRHLTCNIRKATGDINNVNDGLVLLKCPTTDTTPGPWTGTDGRNTASIYVINSTCAYKL